MAGFVCFLALFSQVISGAPPGPTSILVLNSRAVGVAPEVAVRLSGQLAAQIGAHEGYKAVTMAEIQDQISFEADKQARGCESDTACLAEVSRLANSELALSSAVGVVGSTILLSLTLIDVKRAAPVGRASETVSDVDQIEAALPQLLATVMGWEGGAKASTFKLPGGEKISFAVLDLQAAGLDPEIARSLTEVLSEGIKRVKGATVITSDDIKAMLQLEGQKEMLGCSGDSACIAEIGGALGVDKLIVGSVAKLEQSFVISLKLIDSGAIKVDNRITESFQGQKDQLIKAVRHAGRLLLGIESTAVGGVVVSASEDGAAVFVDGEMKGEFPLPPVESLLPGRHALRVAKDGFFNWQTDFYVDAGGTTAVWAKLDERPAKWYQQWWVWAGAGGVALLGGTAAIILTRPEPTTGSGVAIFE